MKISLNDSLVIISRIFLIRTNEDIICIRQKIEREYKNILDIKDILDFSDHKSFYKFKVY